MRVLLAVLLVCITLLTESTILEGSVDKELNIYKAQVRVIYDLLAKDCPHRLLFKRAAPEDLETRLEVQTQLYERLLKELIDCRNEVFAITNTSKGEQTTPMNLTTPTTTKARTIPTTHKTSSTFTTAVTSKTTASTTIPTTTTTIPTISTTIPMTTLASNQPIECQKAINYTEYWRRDHSGAHIKPGGVDSYSGYNCDLNSNDTNWFRFSGAAGNQMLNTCPKPESCGTKYPLWTDDIMPKEIGMEMTVDTYEPRKNNCKQYKFKVRVMRCSWDTNHDLIYKQTNFVGGYCFRGFCGMTSP